jgi:hypothetical protein
MFPAGAPGMALLVLRNCIAVALAGCAFATGWQHLVFVALLSMMCIGLLTPAVCGVSALAALAQLVYLGIAPNANVILIVLSTLSLAFLGPGAFSIDGRLFGRRMLVSTSSRDASPDGSS